MLQFEPLKLRLGELHPELDSLGQAFHIEDLKQELSALENKIADPKFWEDMENSQKILQRQKQITAKLEHYTRLCAAFEDTETLIHMSEEMEDASVYDEVLANIDALEKDIKASQLTTLLNGEYDSKNAILTFHAGAGGVEAQDWVQMLYRMYTRWAERHGYRYKILDYLDGDEAGIKSASILIEGENVFGYLRSESGVHRLVRVSPFDTLGRRQTSFASVEVMPEIEEDTTIVIKETDLKMDTFRSSGAGGQHVNTTDSAVRITHLPTGIVVSCQNERSQFQNRDVAMKMLRSKLAEIKQREHLERIEDIKGVKKEIGWGSQIRSYIFMPYTLVKDHRTGHEVGNINAVMDGDLDAFIDAYLIYNTCSEK